MVHLIEALSVIAGSQYQPRRRIKNQSDGLEHSAAKKISRKDENSHRISRMDYCCTSSGGNLRVPRWTIAKAVVSWCN